MFAKNVESHRRALQISICLKIREWASIAAERRPLFEHAARASLGRSSADRRRSPRAKGFSPKCVPVAAGLCFRIYRDLLCDIVYFRYFSIIGQISSVAK